jgi:drug/metabolite transporter (DMT)-like permease
MQSEVFILAIFGWMFAHEKVGALDWSAIAFGSLGAIIVGYAASASGQGELLGTLAFAGAAIATAGYSVVVRKFAVKFPNADFYSLVWMQNLVSLVLAFLVWPITSQWVSAERTDNALGIAAGLAAGVFGVAIPFLLFTYASKIVPARHSAIALNIVPVVGITVGALIGRGVPTPMQYLGGAMVLLSLLALSKSAN